MFMVRNLAGWNLSFTAPAFSPTGPVLDLIGGEGHPASGVARLTALFLIIFTVFTVVLIRRAGERWNRR